jgi:hypothetical protein
MLKFQELIRRDIVSLRIIDMLLNSFSSTFRFSKKSKMSNTNHLSLCQDKLALNITTEQGKTLKDAQGDVFRGLG